MMPYYNRQPLTDSHPTDEPFYGLDTGSLLQPNPRLLSWQGAQPLNRLRRMSGLPHE